MAKINCFTATIDLSLKNKLETDLRDQGFSLSKPPYTLFSAKKEGVSCTLYESGKLTVQGKEMANFIEFYLEPEILKEFRYTNPDANLNLTPRIGMDEAGKGDFFGPLCIACAYANEEGVKELSRMGVRDSKSFSDSAILKLASELRKKFPHTVIRLFPLKYNELYTKFKNLNRLLAWAHVAALGDLSQKTGCTNAILDQFANKGVVESFLKQKKLSIQLEQRVRGEEDLVVAAASILARAAFLDGMALLSEEYGMTIPKGASAKVKEVARQLVNQFGKDVLPKVSKTHFKTTQHVDTA
ncbi:MAG TPA: ribonuclease HIII [Chlamydiales bacterium]|nr:ribonuclease HIII [Chlamydiales bacterium]